MKLKMGLKRVARIEEEEEENRTVQEEQQLQLELLKLESIRDQLKNDILAAAQNNLNSFMEMKATRQQLVERMIEPLKLRRRIGRKLRQGARRTIGEHEQVLETHLTQLKLLQNQAHADSQLDFAMLKSGGQFECYKQFLKTFVEHRKEFHSHKAKARRLGSDLELLRRMREFCRKHLHQQDT